MEWFVFTQFVVDILLLGIAVKLVLGGWQTRTSANELADLQNLKAEWSQEMSACRKQAAEQLRLLQSICEQAKKILDGKQLLSASFPPSLEENELRNLSEVKPITKIPTLADVEVTKKRLRQESALDLHTLLKEQLA